MHVFAHLLKTLFVIDAEVLLFVDDQKPKPRKLDRFAKQRVRADDNIDGTGFEPYFHFRELFRPDHPRRLRNSDRQALKALAERPEVLPRQQRRRHHERDLQSVHCRDERGTNGDFGLAETDVAADEAVHGLARRQIGKHGVDARRLIFRLFVREARDELVKGPSGRYQHGRFPHRPKRRDLDQLVGDLAQTLLEPCLAGLPADAAEPVELSISLIRAIARQKLDVFDGQKQLVAAGVVKLETIVRGAKRRDRLQARKPPDTVVAVDDEIADRKARRFRQNISGLASARAAAAPGGRQARPAPR